MANTHQRCVNNHLQWLTPIWYVPAPTMTDLSDPRHVRNHLEWFAWPERRQYLSSNSWLIYTREVNVTMSNSCDSVWLVWPETCQYQPAVMCQGQHVAVLGTHSEGQVCPYTCGYPPRVSCLLRHEPIPTSHVQILTLSVSSDTTIRAALARKQTADSVSIA